MNAPQAAAAAPDHAAPSLPPGISGQPASGDPAAPPGRRRSKFSAEPPSGLGPSAGPSVLGGANPAATLSGLPPGLPPQAQPAHAAPAAHGSAPHHAVPAPPFAAAPPDAGLAQRITKLAEFVSRNGPAFEQQVREKQGANVEYAFLHGGPGGDFYRWCLFCMPRQLSLDRPVDGALHSGHAPGAVMPEAVASGFAQVLNVLHGSQESIKASSQWFLACTLHAHGMAHMMLQRVHHLPAFPAQLHVIYLLNDILFSGPPQGPGLAPGANAAMAEVFRGLLPAFFAAAYRTSVCSADAFRQLTGLLHLWRDRGIYPAAFVQDVEAQMLAIGEPVEAAVPAHAAAQPQSGPPPTSGVAGPATGAVPGMHGATLGPAPGGWVPATPAAAVAAESHEPEAQPYDMLSFPAGLIPKLVKSSLKYEKEYTPLRPEDIEREPPPRRPVADTYLTSRLQRFYAELAQYQPGVNRAEYESKLHALGGGLLPSPADGPQSEAMRVSSQTNMRSDGTFHGPGFDRGGIGAHQVYNSDDAYSMYRRQKSGHYHQIMAAQSTNPNRPPMGH